MPSPIYQYVISLDVILLYSRGPGLLINVSVRELRALNSIFLMWQNLLFQHHYHYYPDVESHSQLSVENILFRTFALKSPDRIFVW